LIQSEPAQAGCVPFVVAVSTTGANIASATNLYNQRPTWLDNAHRRPDEAVFAAYGWPAGLSDDEILARLLAQNLERAAGQGQAQPDEEGAKDGEEDAKGSYIRGLARL
jgi:hypothetical protein